MGPVSGPRAGTMPRARSVEAQRLCPAWTSQQPAETGVEPGSVEEGMWAQGGA